LLVFSSKSQWRAKAATAARGGAEGASESLEARIRAQICDSSITSKPSHSCVSTRVRTLENGRERVAPARLEEQKKICAKIVLQMREWRRRGSPTPSLTSDS
jgi:hypothetical protein